MEIIIVLVLLIAFAIVACRWGHDSRDSMDSNEWERRHNGILS